MFINSVTKKVYESFLEIRFDVPILPLSFEFNEENLATVGIFPISENKPEYDPVSQYLTEEEANLEGTTWTKQWTINQVTPEQLILNQNALELANSKKIASKIESLWAAADRYVTSYISGVAFSILAVGVMQGKPKALAVAGWNQAIWTEYYVRKADITLESIDNYDFTSFGAIPHSIPELQIEIGL